MHGNAHTHDTLPMEPHALTSLRFLHVRLALRPLFTMGIALLVGLTGVLGAFTLKLTGDNRAQVVALLLGLAVFTWFHRTAFVQRRGALVAFLLAWATVMILGFVAPSAFPMGSDVHRELRAVDYMGDTAHWDPLALPEISFSSVWLVLGTRMLSDVLGVPPLTVIKYGYPLMQVAAVVPVYLVYERFVSEREAFTAAFLTVSMISFWSGIAQIGKASLSIVLTTMLLLVLLNLRLGRMRTRVTGTLLITGLVLTHYTSALVIILILAAAWVGEYVYATLVDGDGAGLRETGTLVLFGGLLFFTWYQAIPYVSGVLANAAYRPLGIIAGVLAANGEFLREGEGLGESLGDANTLGYWSIRISLVLVTLGMVVGWFREAARLTGPAGGSVPRRRLFLVQTVALGLTAVGLVAPLSLDADRVLAIALVVCMSLVVTWWHGTRETNPEGRLARHGPRALLVGALLIVAGQSGVAFLALDGHAFSANLGTDGPVYARYGFDEETVALRAWAVDQHAGDVVLATENVRDFIHQDHRVEIDDVRTLMDGEEPLLTNATIAGADYRWAVCFVERPSSVPAPHVVYVSGRGVAALGCGEL